MFTEAVNEFKTKCLADFDAKKKEKQALDRALKKLRKRNQKQYVFVKIV